MIKFKVKIEDEQIKSRIKRTLKRNESIAYTLVVLWEIEPATVSDVWKKTVETFNLDFPRVTIFQSLVQLNALKVVERVSLADALTSQSNNKMIEEIKRKGCDILKNLYGGFKNRFLSSYYYYTRENSKEFLRWILENYPEIEIEKK